MAFVYTNSRLNIAVLYWLLIKIRYYLLVGIHLNGMPCCLSLFIFECELQNVNEFCLKVFLLSI